MSTNHAGRHTPAWCDVVHEPDAPIESRYHEQILGEFAAVFGYQPDIKAEPQGECDALIVRRVRYFDSLSDWIIIERAEQASTVLMLREDSARPLTQMLLDLP